MPTYSAAVLRILDENNIPYGDDMIKIVTPLGFQGTARYYINELGVNLDQDQLVDLMKEYMKEAYFNTNQGSNGFLYL